MHTPLGDQRDDTGTFCDDLLDVHHVGVKHGKLGGDAIERILRSGLVTEEAKVIVNDVDGQVFAQLIEAAFVDRLKQARDYRLVGFGLCVFHALIVAASCGSSQTPFLPCLQREVGGAAPAATVTRPEARRVGAELEGRHQGTTTPVLAGGSRDREGCEGCLALYGSRRGESAVRRDRFPEGGPQTCSGCFGVSSGDAAAGQLVVPI